MEKRRITWATAHKRDEVRDDGPDGPSKEGLDAELDAMTLHKDSAEGFVVRETEDAVMLAEEVDEEGHALSGVVLIPKGAILQTWVEA